MSVKLKSKGFISAKDRLLQPRIIASISGLEKQGKTHFALTAPGPIAMFSTDIGEEGVIDKFTNKEVWVMDVARAESYSSKDTATKEFERLKTAYEDLLKGNDVRTIIFDTATEIWEILRLARFGQLTQIMPYQYGPVNAEYRALIRKAYSYDKNVILLHKMKSQYINDKRTGEYERAGFSDTGFLVQVNAQMYRYSMSDGGEFAIYIVDCRQEPSLIETELSGEMCNFPTMASLIFPEVDPSNWE